MIPIILVLISSLAYSANAATWPVPYQRLSSRPTNDPYCQAGLVPFCPSGKTVDAMPVMMDDDAIEVFALKKPVWSFKYGPLMGYFHIMHDGLGFRNKRTGLNYTMEWYELDQLFNCTFPHVLDDNSFIWCNQGALCVYDGINDTVWTQYGFIKKVSEITGKEFNNFANWSIYDNNTAIYYETWTVYNTDNRTDPAVTMYFDSFDCASWVLRALDELYAVGAKFDPNVKLNYTRLNLYGKEPILLGNFSQIMGSGNKTLIGEFIEFYKDFQKPVGGYIEDIEAAVKIYNEMIVKREFFMFYNSLYWYIELQSPFIKITYYEIPLPGTTDNHLTN